MYQSQLSCQNSKNDTFTERCDLFLFKLVLTCRTKMRSTKEIQWRLTDFVSNYVVIVLWIFLVSTKKTVIFTFVHICHVPFCWPCSKLCSKINNISYAAAVCVEYNFNVYNCCCRFYCQPKILCKQFTGLWTTMLMLSRFTTI